MQGEALNAIVWLEDKRECDENQEASSLEGAAEAWFLRSWVWKRQNDLNKSGEKGQFAKV